MPNKTAKIYWYIRIIPSFVKCQRIYYTYNISNFTFQNSDSFQSPSKGGGSSYPPTHKCPAFNIYRQLEINLISLTDNVIAINKCSDN